MEILVLLVAVVFAILVLRRTGAINQDLTELRRETGNQSLLIASLTRRVYELEQRLQSGETARQTATADAHLHQAGLQPAEAGPIEAEAPAVPEQLTDLYPVAHAGETEAPAADSPAGAREDWETVIGTNWLNRAGALVLVIGIALFLGYSLTHMGPAGKVTIGFCTGLSLLALGVVVERNDTYRGFSLGLIGGGWAITYFTGCAMHGIAAARLIDDPFLGLLVLLAISAGMVGHSLRYKSEIATALAFLFAFASLNLSPLTTFSVIATAVLAASLLLVSARFGWSRLSVAGVILTYQTFLIRYDPWQAGRSDVVNSQATLWIYWLLFEVFDLLSLARKGRNRGIEKSIFFLNAWGFFGVVMLHRWELPATEWAGFFAIASAAYLVSSAIRVKLVGRTEDAAVVERVFEGGYEAPAAASAGLLAAALISRFSGLQMPLALLIEGEMVVLAGMALGSRFLRGLGGLVLGAAFLRLVTVDLWEDRKIDVLGKELHHWSPLAVLMAVVFAVNRLRGSAAGILYGAGATLLVASVISAELDQYWGIVAWSVLTLAVLVLGLRLHKFDLRMQAYVGAILCFARAAIALEWLKEDVPALWAAAVTAAIFYTGQQLVRSANDLRPMERFQNHYFSILGTVLVTLILGDAVEGRLLTVAIALQAASLLAIGFWVGERILRLSGLVLFLLCIGKLFIYDMSELDTLARILSFVVLGVMLIAASWVYTRYREKVRRLL